MELGKLYHKEVFERLELYVDDLSSENKIELCRMLFDNIELIDDSLVFFQLNARKRCEIIICRLLNKCLISDYELFLEEIKYNYRKIRIIESVLYWFKSKKNYEVVDKRKDAFEKLCSNLGESIIKNNVNIYDDEYYMQHNIWGLYHLIGRDEKCIKKYIDNILTKNNIFGFLYDITGDFTGEKV